MNVALACLAGAAALALWLGLMARRGHVMRLEQWTVAGRSFGTPLVYLLLAGEIYTTFTFLGASGYAYGLGGPAYFIIAYGPLAFALSYYLLPPVWRYARAHGLVSQADYFRSRYDSPALGMVVALVGLVALVPYLVLQFKGLGIIVQAAGGGSVGKAVAVWIGAAVVTLYVMVSGVRGSAWTAVIKDVGILVTIVALGVYLPWHCYGGIGPMFHAIADARPGFLVLPTQGRNAVWFVSTVALSALGFFMWPHAFPAICSARHARNLRKNAVLLPVYQLVLLFAYFVGFAAILQVPGLQRQEMDLALFRLVNQTFSPEVVGAIGAVGVLTALVPGSMILMSAATLLAHNVYRGLHRTADDARVERLAKALVPVVALVAVGFTLHGSATIVALLLLGYGFVTQLFPGLLASLAPRNPVTSAGAIAGLIAGMSTVAVFGLGKVNLHQLMPGSHAAWLDLNTGVIALAVNVAMMLLVSALTRRRTQRPA